MSDVGWLVPLAQRMLTPDRYAEGHESIEVIEAIVMHYTGGRNGEASARWLARADDNFVSAHFVITREGLIKQLASLGDRTWHAGGRSSKLHGRGNVNGRTLGIEFANIGPLIRELSGTQVTEHKHRYRSTWSNSIEAHPWEVLTFGTMPHGYKYWQNFTTEQLHAGAQLCATIAEKLGWVGHFPMVGHEHIDPTRKMDPGPAFPWDSFRDLIKEYQE